jgi:hypothetical protein
MAVEPLTTSERVLRAAADLLSSGGLRMSVERATLLMHAAGVGFVLTQIGIPTADRDPQLSVIAREPCRRSLPTTQRRRRLSPSFPDVRSRSGKHC